MTPASTNTPVIVEDVVTSLTGEIAAGPGARTAFKERMQRAMDEFDVRTAEAFARALIDSLTQAPDDVRQLEALVILGLSHPEVLEKNRISLDKEAERLIVLLQKTGQDERAGSLRELLDARMTVETVDTSAVADRARAHNEQHRQLVERYLRRADEAVLSGHTKEAIACLQEVMGLEPGRRDVARMIRGLRQRQRDTRSRTRRRLKLAAVLIVVFGLGAFLWNREDELHAEFVAFAPANGRDADALRARLERVETLLERERVWFGMGEALRERTRLRDELQRLADEAERERHARTMSAGDRLIEADAARERGLLMAQRAQFADAASDFKRALELAPAQWEHRKRVQADLAAIEKLLDRAPQMRAPATNTPSANKDEPAKPAPAHDSGSGKP